LPLLGNGWCFSFFACNVWPGITFTGGGELVSPFPVVQIEEKKKRECLFM
jgi:hypothetical protein